MGDGHGLWRQSLPYDARTRAYERRAQGAGNKSHQNNACGGQQRKEGGVSKDPKYTVPDFGREVRICSECGAAVFNLSRHTNWHREQDNTNALAKAGKFVMSSGGDEG
jgi:hypothetical protein